MRRAARAAATIALIFSALVVMAVSLTLGSAVSAYAYYSEQLPEPGISTVRPTGAEPTRLYDRTGQIVLYEVADPLGDGRAWVSLSDVPDAMRDATVALEDPTFYAHPGYDALEAIQSAWANLTGGQPQGGSALTRRLVKNLLQEPSGHLSVTLDDKMRELVLVTRIGEHYEPDQILEWYLNTNFYGNLAYGVEAASEVYFGKPVNQLTLAESAMLAPIPDSPALNPIDNPVQAKERQALALKAMVVQGYITQEQADESLGAPLDIQPAEQHLHLLAPQFAIASRKQLEEIVGPDLVYRGGLVVYTTLDYGLFLQAECAARSHVARLSGQAPDTVVAASDGSKCVSAGGLQPLSSDSSGVDHHVSNAAVIVMDAQNGEVLALVGSLDYYNLAMGGGANLALSDREAGSIIKPFAYLTAFQQGYTPATMMLDVHTEFAGERNQTFAPSNFDGVFHGPISLRTALANSYNIPAVQAATWVGVDNVIRTAHALGVNSLSRGFSQYGLDLMLGGGDVTLGDLTYAYSVLANQGEMRGRPTPEDRRQTGYRTLDPVLILRVEDSDGEILWEYGKSDTFKSAPVVEPSLAYLVTDILSDDASRQVSVGPNSALKLDRPAAVMMGMTSDFHDNWTVGYTPQMVTGVWVGNTDNTPIVDLPAIEGAAPIWKAVMTAAHNNLPVQPWTRPDDIVELSVCQPSGLLPTPYCPTRQEIFKRGTEPLETDNIYVPIAINKDTGLLATVFTPPQLVEQRIYEVLPPGALDWAHAADIPQPPTAYDTIGVPSGVGNVAITQPAAFSYVRGTVEIRGNAQDGGFHSYRLDYGAGLNPDQWFQIGSTSQSPVSNGSLASWDSTGLDGLFSVRLTMIRADNSFEESIIQVTVDNVPPSAVLASPTNGQQFSLSDDYLLIQPIIADNVAMDRVEFYVDNALFITMTAPPYSVRWPFAAPGDHIIQVRAYDAAGNSAASEQITVKVVP